MKQNQKKEGKDTKKGIEPARLYFYPPTSLLLLSRLGTVLLICYFLVSFSLFSIFIGWSTSILLSCSSRLSVVVLLLPLSPLTVLLSCFLVFVFYFRSPATASFMCHLLSSHPLPSLIFSCLSDPMAGAFIRLFAIYLSVTTVCLMCVLICWTWVG